MVVFGRRNLLLGGGSIALLGAGALTLGLSGCNNSNESSGITPDDMAIGNPDSGVTLIEYGSSMCSHCREFEETVFDRLKENYIDTGKIHFVFREVLAPVDAQRIIPTIALAEYQLARCNNATPEQYFSRLGVLFEQQPAMFQAGSRQGIEAKLVEIGGAAGLSREQVLACVNDPAGAERMNRLGQAATRDNVSGTPTFFLNGERLEDPSIMTYDGMAAALDAAIAARGSGS